MDGRTWLQAAWAGGMDGPAWLSMYSDEGGGWRCHSLAEDGYQCECWLRKGRYDGIEGYFLRHPRNFQSKGRNFRSQFALSFSGSYRYGIILQPVPDYEFN